MIISGLDYLHISQLFIGIMLFVVFLMVWKTIERKPYVLLWSLMYVFSTLGGILNAISEIFPSRDVYWIVVNAVSLVVQTLAFAGFRLRAGKKGFPNALLIFMFSMELLVIWFTIVTPHMGLRMLFIPLSGGLIMLLIAQVIGSKKDPVQPAEFGAIAILILYGVSQFTAGFVALQQGAQLDEYYLNIYSQINFLATPALVTGMGMFTIFILTNDLATRMKQLAITDQLTGVLNRRGFEDAAMRALAMAKRKQTSTSVVVADIDHFKKINDTYGHRFGDKSIKAFTRVLEDTMRDTDIIGRVGGEEFIIMMQDTDLDTCLEVTERIRQAVDDEIVSKSKKKADLTASFGIALFSREATLEQVIHDADQALYIAKEQGRNRVEVFRG